jgi:hypothetical protein
MVKTMTNDHKIFCVSFNFYPCCQSIPAGVQLAFVHVSEKHEPLSCRLVAVANALLGMVNIDFLLLV